jgi:5-methylcytosine-specific restriction endonuclease McrA
MRRRRRVPADVRRWVMRRQLGRCAGPCGEVLPETYQLDHRMPWCLTRDDRASNLDALCPNCHALKTRHEARALHALALLRRRCPGQRLCHACYRVASEHFPAHPCPGPAAPRPKLDVPRVLLALDGLRA